MAYSEDQIGEALARLAANAGNAERTRRDLEAAGWKDVPTRSTLRRWQEAEAAPTSPREVKAAKNGHQKKKELAALFEQLARACLDEASGKISEASFSDLMKGAGIATDKMKLLRGEATDIREQRGDGASIYQQFSQQQGGVSPRRAGAHDGWS